MLGCIVVDLVICNIEFLDVISGEWIFGDIVICGDCIVGICEFYSGNEEIDGFGLVVVFGFIDIYVYCEFSLVIFFEFDCCVLFWGIIMVICDFYEIVNVLGCEGIWYFMDCVE